MSAPVCRVCYAHSLPDGERRRFLDEPVTSCIHYCDEHQAVVDQLHAIAFPFIKSSPLPEGLTFPRVEDADA